MGQTKAHRADTASGVYFVSPYRGVPSMKLLGYGIAHYRGRVTRANYLRLGFEPTLDKAKALAQRDFDEEAAA